MALALVVAAMVSGDSSANPGYSVRVTGLAHYIASKGL